MKTDYAITPLELPVTKTVQFQPVYLIVEAGVRYWEDATVNGVSDEDGSLIPLRRGELWAPVINLADGHITNWPVGTTADISCKVCDAGRYWLQDADGNRVKWNGDYVPDDLLAAGNGYGDYIIMKVNEDGFIEGWKMPRLNPKEWTYEPIE